LLHGHILTYLLVFSYEVNAVTLAQRTFTFEVEVIDPAQLTSPFFPTPQESDLETNEIDSLLCE